MTYTVREIYYTLQGEGAQTGRPAVFLRFAGCNLWSGREKDRAGAVCNFCDTEFVGTGGPGGGKFDSGRQLAAAVSELWPRDTEGSGGSKGHPYVVCTGGEPLLQLDSDAIRSLHEAGFEIGVETNGTIRAPDGIDWLCVSPKAAATVVQTSGDELKLVYPQDEHEAQPEKFAGLEFGHFFLQPLDNDAKEKNTRAAIEYCIAHPQWRLSLQTHKLIGIA
jgi:7-carboxy-7-deazaguanine synthase (Cx14CxxC type)